MKNDLFMMAAWQKGKPFEEQNEKDRKNGWGGGNDDSRCTVCQFLKCLHGAGIRPPGVTSFLKIKDCYCSLERKRRREKKLHTIDTDK